MKKILISTICLLFLKETFSQGDTTAKMKKTIFRTTVYADYSIIGMEYLVQIKDSGIVMTDRPIAFNEAIPPGMNFQRINHEDIEKITIHGNKSVGKHALTGLIAGGIFGLLIGIPLSKSPGNLGFTAGHVAIAFSLVGVGLGSLMGLLSKQVFSINKKPENFNRFRATVLERVYGSTNHQYQAQ